MQGMNPLIKDWIEVISSSIAILGGLIAAFAAIYQLRANRLQRQDELRWRRANAAKSIIEDIHHDEHAMNAVTMLDWSEGEHKYEIEKDCKVIISYKDDVIPALKKDQSKCSEGKDWYIIDSFDWFFYLVGRVEHYIQTDLIEFTDVKDVFKPYADKTKAEWPIYKNFMESCSHHLAVKFWQRYGA